MSFYSCPCMNIKVLYDNAEFTESRLDECEQAHACLIEFSTSNTASTIKSASGLFKKSNKCLKRTISDSLANENDPASSECTNTFIKIKYPQLIGTLEKISQDNTKLTLVKCLICDIYSHCLLLDQHLKSESSAHKLCFIVLNEQELFNEPPIPLNELMQKYNQFSAIYNIILPEYFNQTCARSNLDELKVKLSTLIEQEKSLFLQSIQKDYDAFISNNKDSISKEILEKEKSLKAKLEELIGFYVEVNGSARKTTKEETNLIQSNLSALHGDDVKFQKKQSKKKKKSSLSNKLDANNNNNELIDGDVFEFENFDEKSHEENKKYNFDEINSSSQSSQSTDGEESESDKTKNQNDSVVLKKRNTNVESIGGQTSYNLSIKNKMLNNASYGKYSCSLPREIPALLHHHFSRNHSKNTLISDNSNHKNINDENKIDEDLFESNYLLGKNDKENEDVDDEEDSSDDDIYGEDRRPEETKTKNMGQAISDLASSIVEKDGRELFGGVPSRRVPINSISQSFF